MIISDGKILAMRDERSPYYYLPDVFTIRTEIE